MIYPSVKKPFEVIAHRGASLQSPENTLEAFEEALSNGATGFECDVRLSKDGEPYVLHTPFNDDKAPTSWHVQKGIRSLTWTEISNLSLAENGKSYRIPLLYDVLELAKKKDAKIFIEPKENSQNLIEKLVKSISEYDLIQRATIITFHSRRHLLEYSKELDKRIGTNAIILSPFSDISDRAKIARADSITIGWKNVNHFRLFSSLAPRFKNQVESAESLGIRIFGGFADNPADVIWLKEIGADGLFTNDILNANAVLEGLQSK